jgi:YD repeat-containing protein
MNKIRNNKLAKAVIILIITMFFINSTSAFAGAAQFYGQHQEELEWKKILNANLNEGELDQGDLFSQGGESQAVNSENKEIDTNFSQEKAQSEHAEIISEQLDQEPDDNVEPNNEVPVSAPAVGIIIASDYLHMGSDTINPSGNFTRTYVDMSYTAPGFTVNISRTYNSLDRRTSLFSTGWTLGFQGKVDISGTNVMVRLPDGSGQSFIQESNGSYTPQDSRSKLERLGTNSGTYNYLLTTPDQYKYHFNNACYLDYMEDRNGNKITLTVDSSGKVSKITDQAGKETDIYYTSNRISSITEQATNRTVSYAYDSSNRLSTVTDPMGNKTYYTYTTIGSYSYLFEIKNHNSAVLESLTYHPVTTLEPNPKIKTISNANGITETYSYSATQDLVTSSDNGNPVRTTITWYDEMHYPIQILDAGGRYSFIEYNLENNVNKYGEVKKSTNRNGNYTQYTYDSQGNVTKMIRPGGGSTTYTYDSKNNLTSEIVGVQATYFVYDMSGNMTKKARRLNGSQDYSSTANQNDFAITNYAYTNKAVGTRTIYGLLQQETDPEGGISLYTYDNYGNLASISRLRAGSTYYTTSYQYNKLGWLTKETTPRSHATNYYYDKNGRLLKKTMPDSGVERYVYDAYGNLKQKITPNQLNVTDSVQFDSNNIISNSGSFGPSTCGYRYDYSIGGTMLKETDPLGYTSQYTYDIYGNKKTETKPAPEAAATLNPAGAVYAYTYDVLNRLTKREYKPTPNISYYLEEYTYSVLNYGQTSVKESKFFTSGAKADTTITYNSMGLIAEQKNPDGGVITYAYSVNGDLVNTIDPKGNFTYYLYDTLNRLTEQWTPADNGQHSYIKFEYDKCDRVTYKYSGLNLVYPVIPASYTIWSRNEYNKDGTVSQKTNSQGCKTVYIYDADGNVSEENQYTSSNAFNIIDYAYNSMGQLSSKTAYADPSDLFGYNGIVQVGIPSTYTYDKQGNLLTAINHFSPASSVTTTNTYDLMNRQLSTSQLGLTETGASTTLTSSKTYDWAGNVLTETDTNGKITGYIYNARGFLTRVSNPLGGVTYYSYDLAGRKVAEVSPKNYENSGSNYPESPHPYANNYTNTWSYTHPTEATGLAITFSGDTKTEANYDKIYIMDSSGNNIPGSPFSGTSLAGQTKIVPGNSFQIKLTTDGSGTDYGFKIIGITTETLSLSNINRTEFVYDGMDRLTSQTER